MSNFTAEEINSCMKFFEPMYINGKSNPPDDEDVVTMYCDNGKDEIGFVENVKWEDGGIEKFICKKWIWQDKLNKLMLAIKSS